MTRDIEREDKHSSMKTASDQTRNLNKDIGEYFFLNLEGICKGGRTGNQYTYKEQNEMLTFSVSICIKSETIR